MLPVQIASQHGPLMDRRQDICPAAPTPDWLGAKSKGINLQAFSGCTQTRRLGAETRKVHCALLRSSTACKGESEPTYSMLQLRMKSDVAVMPDSEGVSIVGHDI